MSPQGETSPNAPIPRGAMWLILAALSAGVAVAAHLVWIKLRLEFDPSYVSSCNFSAKLNCDAVQTSEYASVFGYPLALFGLATYIFFALLVTLGRKANGITRAFHSLLAFASILGCLHSSYLAYISSAVIGAYCLFCMAMYAINGLVAGASAVFVFQSYGVRGAAGRVFGHPASLAGAAVIYALVLGASIPAYSHLRENIKEARMVEVRKEVSQRTISEKAEPSEKGGAPQPTTRSKTPKRRGDALKDGLKRKGAMVYSETLTRKGRSFLKIPAEPDDFGMGPIDAPVTIVEFADFECGYCRMLAQNLKPLKKKYEGKVRWVFKHFPLNNTCNKVMKGIQHPRACAAARAANCAGIQELFWPMHDQLFANPRNLTDEDLKSHAEAVGADVEKWSACMSGPEVDTQITEDTVLGRFARISGTPRMYINGHLVPGVHATEVLDYYIQSALEAPEPKPTTEPEPQGEGGMIKAAITEGEFYIDAYEASIDAGGAAVSKSGVPPAQTSWFEAKSACKKAGKRLCSEEEWISACTGSPAIDNDEDLLFSDDAIEGKMFPYGFFHKGGFCHDNEPKNGGKSRPTGSFPDCRTPSGIYDLSGNLAEWTGTDQKDAAVTGSYFSYGPKASCIGRQTRFGPGYRNETTGFRCCSDNDVDARESDAVAHMDFALEGSPFPAIKVDKGDGTFITEKEIKGAVHIVSFFASWCGPCRKELPAFNDFFLENRDKGLKVLAIGVDLDTQKAKTFAEEMKLEYTVGYDPEAVSMGACSVKGMPTALLVDDEGVIRGRLVGINQAKTDAFLAKTSALLKP